MDTVSLVEGVGAPLRRSTVDTDQIIPAKFLKRITKTGYDDALFYEWRQDPEFILNNPPYDKARVLVAGPDFGTGSSREHAVWALRDFGFGAVISSRFGDIFRGNAGKQGLVVATVPQEIVEAIWAELEAHPGQEVAVDVASREVRCGAITAPFEIDDYTRWRLMEGLDDIGLTLRHEDAIDAFETTRASWRPRTLPVLGG
ncbi:3-isopropylmalate/(R)-2-methylmalate dehydratase small subunit [Pontimonas salivibrio]|uniref:3-isopropylmalate dehydratase small subunit n=1 Tax=Pontimonas salivibrio TaxID=1159327 RepID=A0A2L2BPG5_9MICO|nr:3-isopropylmalate dehydratase small subunit [Pontimonas salivibrio]AVG23555.1 3-isopropylmalate/(R)-2-methylmalate dehydratase small subunit [Pontimonas salivibrio]